LTTLQNSNFVFAEDQYYAASRDNGNGLRIAAGRGCAVVLGGAHCGQSGIASIEKIATTGLRNANGGEVRGFDWSLYGDEGDCDEASQFAFAAAYEAIADAHISPLDLSPAGLVFSTNFAGAASWEFVCEQAREDNSEAGGQSMPNCFSNSHPSTPSITPHNIWK
jgi:3-oxoacyl-(acyl-carrier-protein) synthase